MSVEETDLSEWSGVIESLADRILWDRDFEMAESFLDAAPAVASVQKSMLGIDQDYFAAAATDPGPAHVESTLDRIRQITHRKPR